MPNFIFMKKFSNIRRWIKIVVLLFPTGFIVRIQQGLSLFLWGNEAWIYFIGEGFCKQTSDS